ncbi:hypothetical protein E3P92_02100 [Wallemia ichthyophaga]|nr:hypothetical protein E3P92_02100 [Wallemia ichthyophaga]
MSEDQDLANQATEMNLGDNQSRVAQFHDHIRAEIAEAVANERAANEARIRALQEELERQRSNFEATQQAKEDAYRVFWQETTRKLEKKNQKRNALNVKNWDAKLKIKEPQTFAGGVDTLKIIGWVVQLNTYFKYIRDTEEKKTEYAAGLITGHARYWYVQYRKTQGEDLPPWKEFEQVLINTFGNQVEHRNLGQYYMDMRLTGVARNITTRPLHVGNFEIHNFTRALKPREKEYVMGKLPKTLGEAHQHALDYEKTTGRNNTNSQKKFGTPNFGFFTPPPQQRKFDEAVPVDLNTTKAGRMSKIQCYNCRQRGHISRKCPHTGRTKQVNLTGIDVDTPEDKMITAPVRTYGEETRELLDTGASADFVDKHFVGRITAIFSDLLMPFLNNQHISNFEGDIIGSSCFVRNYRGFEGNNLLYGDILKNPLLTYNCSEDCHVHDFGSVLRYNDTLTGKSRGIAQCPALFGIETLETTASGGFRGKGFSLGKWSLGIIVFFISLSFVQASFDGIGFVSGVLGIVGFAEQHSPGAASNQVDVRVLGGLDGTGSLSGARGQTPG